MLTKVRARKACLFQREITKKTKFQERKVQESRFDVKPTLNLLFLQFSRTERKEEETQANFS